MVIRLLLNDFTVLYVTLFSKVVIFNPSPLEMGQEKKKIDKGER
jgi:hypothetical protein